MNHHLTGRRHQATVIVRDEDDEEVSTQASSMVRHSGLARRANRGWTDRQPRTVFDLGSSGFGDFCHRGSRLHPGLALPTRRHSKPDTAHTRTAFAGPVTINIRFSLPGIRRSLRQVANLRAGGSAVDRPQGASGILLEGWVGTRAIVGVETTRNADGARQNRLCGLLLVRRGQQEQRRVATPARSSRGQCLRDDQHFG